MVFNGKNVLVTGASRGIGADIARALSSFGLKVWINYNSNSTKADELKKEIEDNGGQASVIGFDVSKEKDFVDAIKLIVDSDGELSYLVNNAGITNDKLALRMSLEDFESLMKINLSSAFIGCREALKVMSKKRFGSIVNIASIVADTGNIGQVNYTASKGGLVSMTKSFALEGALRGIRYNLVSPGFIFTDMTNKLDENLKQKYIDSIPLKRLGLAKDIANGVCFLLSDYASYITGENLNINGGLRM